MPDKIAVLIPCYNESKTVAKVIRDMRKALPESVIYVYDNNSTDGTDEIARKEGAVVRYEYQQGKGNVIRSGAVCSRDGIFYSGTDPLSGSGNCEQTAYTDRKWICDHDSDYLLVFRNYPVYTGQSAQAGF